MTEQELRRSVATIISGWQGVQKGTPEQRTIIDTYNTIKPLPRKVRMSYTMEWCAATVSAAFQTAGLIDLIPAECSCGLMLQGAQSMGIWVERDDYNPKLGDIILYDWQDTGKGDNTGAPDHVGIVTAVSGNKFTVTEGNMGSPSRVGVRTMIVNGRYIRGFITPDYASKAAVDKPWYQEAMDWARETGLMDGTRPLDNITRAEVATICMRLYKLIKGEM